MPFYNVQCWAEQIFACWWWLGWMWLCYSLNEFILLFEFSIFSFGFELNSCITLAFNLILPIGPWAEWLALNWFGLVLYIEDVVSDLFANDKHFSFAMTRNCLQKPWKWISIEWSNVRFPVIKNVQFDYFNLE